MALFRRSEPPAQPRPHIDSLDAAEAWLRSQGPTWRQVVEDGRQREIGLDERRSIASGLMSMRAMFDDGKVTP